MTYLVSTNDRFYAEGMLHLTLRYHHTDYLLLAGRSRVISGRK
jgi:hypothetical protein